jgi:hypothetical protein
VRNAISRLRSVGLRELLVTTDDGYALDGVEVALEEIPGPSRA